jgi:hypothetical protein
MSFNLMVFDQSAAPREQKAFDVWSAEQLVWLPDRSYKDVSLASPALRQWFIEIIRKYPAHNSPEANAQESSPYIVDYLFKENIIYMDMSWDIAEQARKDVFFMTELFALGLFDFSAGKAYWSRDEGIKNPLSVTYDDTDNEDPDHYSGESKLTLFMTLKLFDGMQWEKGSFLYFPLTDTNLFQIMGDGDGQFLMEFTNDSPDMSFMQKQGTREDCRNMIVKVFGKTSVEPVFLEGFKKILINTPDKKQIIQKYLVIGGFLLVLIGLIVYFIVSVWFI